MNFAPRLHRVKPSAKPSYLHRFCRSFDAACGRSKSQSEYSLAVAIGEQRMNENWTKLHARTIHSVRSHSTPFVWLMLTGSSVRKGTASSDAFDYLFCLFRQLAYAAFDAFTSEFEPIERVAVYGSAVAEHSSFTRNSFYWLPPVSHSNSCSDSLMVICWCCLGVGCCLSTASKHRNARCRCRSTLNDLKCAACKVMQSRSSLWHQ